MFLQYGELNIHQREQLLLISKCMRCMHEKHFQSVTALTHGVNFNRILHSIHRTQTLFPL